MNCANHADQPAVAYCRTCGKAMCANCTRPVRGVIYCEDCLGARMQSAPSASTTPAPGFVAGNPGAAPAGSWAPVATPSAMPLAPPIGSGSGPNPTVAGILAGFFPFGVGPVYCGQYAKGLSHLAIFGLLIAGCNAASNSSHGEALGIICALGLSFFYVYQIIDSVRTARALQVGLPVPDPYGLAATFGGGTKIETSKVPIGAIVLILLGLLFLLNTMGFELGLDRFWPLILIVIGFWLFARNWGLWGQQEARLARLAKSEGFVASHGNPVLVQQAIATARCQCARCRSARIMGPAVLVTLGFLFLFETLGRLSFNHSWPILLLVIGGVKLFQSTASAEGHVAFTPPAMSAPPGSVPPIAPPAPPAPPAAPSASSEVNHG